VARGVRSVKGGFAALGAECLRLSDQPTPTNGGFASRGVAAGNLRAQTESQRLSARNAAKPANQSNTHLLLLPPAPFFFPP